jgi:hypothetical protein
MTDKTAKYKTEIQQVGHFQYRASSCSFDTAASTLQASQAHQMVAIRLMQ